jgi:hypothetical protein
VLRTARLAARPSIPLRLRDRVHVRTALTGEARAELLRPASIVVPSPDGLRRLREEAAAAGCAVVDPPNVASQPELAAAALLRFAEDESAREKDAAVRRASMTARGFADEAAALDRLYAAARTRRRAARRHETEQLADRDWIVVDLHMHTNHSRLLDRRRAVAHAGRRAWAIGVTDRNVLGGALEIVSWHAAAT